ncbi:MAG: GNAT family N-acetyltransferase [Candidatus Thorarchaeota archaeon]|jgi:ribosomal protein S18 acetylase RimI-like enzyme
MSGDLVRVTMSELDKGVEILVNAFWDDPLNLYFIPESENRRKLFSDYLHVRLKFAVRYGEVYSTSPNFEGIAAWFPPGKSDLTYFRLLRVGFLGLIRLLGMKTVSRMNRVGSHGTKIRKQYLPEPHWHLFPIAVDPKHQKKGFASALMRPMLDKIQSQGLPCFLETLNEDYVSLYEHYGFEVTSKKHYLVSN